MGGTAPGVCNVDGCPAVCPDMERTRPDGVGLSEAAAQLGITSEALRKRIARGSVQATRWRGRWFVQVSGRESGRVSSQSPDASGRVSGEVVRLRDEVLWLREELGRRDRQVEQLHTLLAQAQRVLPAPVAEVSQTVRRRWWRFW